MKMIDKWSSSLTPAPAAPERSSSMGPKDRPTKDVSPCAASIGPGKGEKENTSWEVDLMSQAKPSTVPASGETHSLEVELNLLKARVSRIEKQIQVLAEANLVLARGMEAGPMQEPGQMHPEQAARLAHELLLAAGLVKGGG
ncbi:hypothetical protein ABT061_00230 [Streptosporangium sp. NPDC002544]|uniref:hypothetical protein n=1 Tax=Streptosporangium sp. NPDC002544 TaxID=3154538 RepID=UPI003329F033